MKKRIAIFASGSGSNAQKIMAYFKKHPDIEVAILLTNNPKAYALERAGAYNIPTCIFNKHELYHTNYVTHLLVDLKIDLIVLAGFLWLIPKSLLKAFPKKIINIHPALLPKYGGKGMYGDYVHQKVLDQGECESGITIHFVNERFDEGEVIYQARFPIEHGYTIDTIKLKGQELEHQHYSRVIENLLMNKPKRFPNGS